MTSGRGEIKLFINACGIRTDQSKQVTDHQEWTPAESQPSSEPRVLILSNSSPQSLLNKIVSKHLIFSSFLRM